MEECVLSVGKVDGCNNVKSVSRMNQAVGIFLRRW